MGQIYQEVAAAAKSLQSCPTLRPHIDGSPPGSSIPGILQARTLEWVAISFSNAWKWKVKVKSLSHVQLLVTPWTAAYQTPPSMGFSRQEYWSGVPLPSPITLAEPCHFPWKYVWPQSEQKVLLWNDHTGVVHWSPGNGAKHLTFSIKTPAGLVSLPFLLCVEFLLYNITLLML